MLKEFKEFAVKGNVMDMAIGIILGAAFGKIVASLVNDVLMPFVGKLMGGVDFSQLYHNLSDTTYETMAAATEAGAPIVKYGQFIQSIIDFLIIAFTIFMVVKAMNKAQRPEPEEEPTTKECPSCFSEVNIKATRCPHCTSNI